MDESGLNLKKGLTAWLEEHPEISLMQFVGRWITSIPTVGAWCAGPSRFGGRSEFKSDRSGSLYKNNGMGEVCL